jgi:hypothetical protein
MNQSPEERNQRSVICLFCGQSTAVPEQRERRRSETLAQRAFRGSIVRCSSCSKEALYLAEEITDFQAA